MLKRILIATPCYNEETNIKVFYQAISSLVSKNENLKEKYQFEILFVNDGSKDSTLDKIKEVKNESKDILVHYLSFSRNFGKEAAMKACFDYSYESKYDSMILMDTDLQDDPNVIPALIAKWEEGYEHIYTKHKSRKGQGIIKKVCSNLFYKIYAYLTGFKEIENGARDFALFDKKVVEAYANYPNQERFTKGISAYVGFKKCCVEFDYAKRQHGKTKWNYKKLFKYAFTGFNSFSTWINLIPRILLLLTIILFGYDLTIAIINFDTFANLINTPTLRTDLLSIFVCIATEAILSVSYQTKHIAESKQLYIVSEAELNDEK